MVCDSCTNVYRLAIYLYMDINRLASSSINNIMYIYILIMQHLLYTIKKVPFSLSSSRRVGPISSSFFYFVSDVRIRVYKYIIIIFVADVSLNDLQSQQNCCAHGLNGPRDCYFCIVVDESHRSRRRRRRLMQRRGRRRVSQNMARSEYRLSERKAAL